MKNVMLIGDSIRLGYEGRVRELLGSDVTVVFARRKLPVHEIHALGKVQLDGGVG